MKTSELSQVNSQQQVNHVKVQFYYKTHLKTVEIISFAQYS